MNNAEKATKLFEYIKELYEQRYQTVINVRNQEWYKFLNEIPLDKENIILNYFDKTDDEEIADDMMVILEVHNPNYEKCPKIPNLLKEWISDDWTDFNVEISPKDSIVWFEKGKEIRVKFNDSENLVREFKEWNRQRKDWVIRQRHIKKTKDLFYELRDLHSELEKNSETIELMIGQGILDCKNKYDININHPLLLKKVVINFEPIKNIITVCDTDENPELYNMLLQEVDDINHGFVSVIKTDLSTNFYHPLDRNETPYFLKKLAHGIHAHSKYEPNSFEKHSIYEKIIIYNNPVFFVRKRIGGVLRAIDDIIDELKGNVDITGPLLNLISTDVPQFSEVFENYDFNQSLAAISGEDKDILLTKEANKEQLDIAKRIENYNAVLVQGPPGTGKTHTIANLLGHFLAQGKSVLVTSHTKKALSVLKSKVAPEIQHLCVSVLDDNSRDMERSVDGITEYISTHNSLEIAENIEKIKKERETILDNLSEVRKKIYKIKFREKECITFGGVGYSVTTAARFVYDNNEKLSNIIPGTVSLYKSLPVSISDLELLYQTNKEVSIEEEIELNYDLPNPQELLPPDEMAKLLNLKREHIESLKELEEFFKPDILVNKSDFSVLINGEPFCPDFCSEKLEELKTILLSNPYTDSSRWKHKAILDGKGKGHREVWQKLIDIIKETRNYSGETALLTIGKKIPFSDDQISEESIYIINQIKEYLNNGKSITNLTLITRRSWKKIIDQANVQNFHIKTVKDCDILIALITLYLKRQEIGSLWVELIEKNDGTPFAKFGSEPEQACISFVEEIEKCLNWYNSDFSKIKTLISKSGFNDSCFDFKMKYTDPIDEIKYTINFVYETLQKYIQLAEVAEYKLPVIINEINNTIQKLKVVNLSSSEICKSILSSIQTEDENEYKLNYKKLNTLYTKYFYQRERKRVLREIKEYAPEWAVLIEKRVGIHGENKVPENIEDAWKWKQFVGILDDITNQPFEELQYQLAEYNLNLRKTTTKLAENLAWFHLLKRVEPDVTLSRALNSWKQYAKKIGKGTGKRAPKLKREAQSLMARCQTAVPAWVMTVNKALESLDPVKNKFDIVIVDEASQSDISSLAIMYLAKKIIIVGDDEQVSPSGIGIDIDKMNNLIKTHIKGVIPESELYDMKSSLYDIGKVYFPHLMLKEHFRCVPSIIGYCNRLSYEYKIKPLRDDSDLIIKPATIAYRVDGQRDNYKRNEVEAKTIVALMIACMKQPEYKDMTFGAISLLGEEQAKIIEKFAFEKMTISDYDKHKILCGTAAQFQGDERDIIFVSLVDNNEDDGLLRMVSEGSGNSTKQRYNVAVSRAKNQLWVVHSLDVNNDLKPGDMRKDLIEYVTNPNDFQIQENEIKLKADSEFEISVANFLIKNGYHIKQQYPVGSYRIDIVAVCGDKKIAIECDGDAYHSGEEQIRNDMERQAILERLGWKFIRIRGSEYYRNPENTMERVISKLRNYEIKPEQNINVFQQTDSRLKQRVTSLAEKILAEWDNNDNNIKEADEELLMIA